MTNVRQGNFYTKQGFMLTNFRLMLKWEAVYCIEYFTNAIASVCLTVTHVGRNLKFEIVPRILVRTAVLSQCGVPGYFGKMLRRNFVFRNTELYVWPISFWSFPNSSVEIDALYELLLFARWSKFGYNYWSTFEENMILHLSSFIYHCSAFKVIYW